MTNWNKLFTGLIAGAVAGAIAGLLFAPKPGKETRNIVATRADELKQKAGEAMGSLRQKIRKEDYAHSAAESSNNDHGAASN